MFEVWLIKYFKNFFLYSADFSFPNKLFTFLTLTSNMCLHALFLHKKPRPPVVSKIQRRFKIIN